MSESFALVDGYLDPAHPIAAIKVGHVYRRELGDLGPLCASIREVGLLQPIVLAPGSVLVAGLRRLEAHRALGRADIPSWIATNISSRLLELLAAQHENTLRKTLNPVEAAELYAELKAHYAADAARRQEATRFVGPDGGVDSTPPKTSSPASEPVCRRPRTSSWLDPAAPGERPSDLSGNPSGNLSGSGAGHEPGTERKDTTSTKSRVQAARAITGRDSHGMLDRVLELKALLERPDTPEWLRAEVEQALDQIREDGKVNGPYQDIQIAQARAELETLAGDEGVSPATRQAAKTELAGLDEIEHRPTAARAAKAARKRVRRRNSEDGWADTSPVARDHLAAKRFSDWLDSGMAAWWEDYDATVIGRLLDEEHWARLLATHQAATAFVEQARAARETQQ